MIRRGTIILAMAIAMVGIGTVGAMTARIVPAGQRAVAPAKAHEIAAVADMVCREARGEPFEGQMAVAYVVENRRRSTLWPASIEAVVRQGGQFNAVHDTRHDGECRTGSAAQRRAFRAAAIALTDLDANHGATFFDRCDTAPAWMRAKDLKARIGAHCFWGESDAAPR